MPPLTLQEEGLTKRNALSLPLPYVRCLLSRSRMCLGRHCRATRSMCPRWEGVPTCVHG